MNKIYLLFVFCLMSFAGSAAVNYYPNGISTPYGGAAQSACLGAKNTAATATYTVCPTSLPGGGINATVTWYFNGVSVYTTSITPGAAGGTLTLPANQFTYTVAGTYTGTGAGSGLYCALSWSTFPSPCGSVFAVNSAATDVVVNVPPDVITGTAAVCVNSFTTLADDTLGGAWTSGSPLIATVGSSSGSVSGLAAGNAVISYQSSTTGCFATRTVTVNPLPNNITGTTNVCEGLTTPLGETTGGGTWTSNSTANATVGTSGIVTGVLAGSAIISYTLNTGCYKTTTVSVNQSPSSISGPLSACTGTTVTLNSLPAGGIWTSGTTGVASINFGTGVVTASTAGVSTILYTLGNGCKASAVFTVNLTPAAITNATTGSFIICENSASTLNDATAGGTWSSDNTGVATIGPVTSTLVGTGAGIANISYILPTGCYNTTAVTVNAAPAPIVGSSTVCINSTTTFTNTVGGGAWTSSNTGFATVDFSTGVVTGVATGNATIKYELVSSGCFVTAPIHINPLPAAITGPNTVCVGGLIILADGTAGGTWSSSMPSVAQVGSSSGYAISGITAGTATISYTLPTSCASTYVITVNPLPSAISGTQTVCVGLTTTLGSTPTPGTWVSSTTSVATIGLTSGTVTGVASGNSVITYKVTATGCITTTLVTVNTTPAAITGTLVLCEGAISPLSDANTPGTWSSSNTSVASIGGISGVVGGGSGGTSTITYTLGTGCIRTAVVTVNPLPATISGPGSVCAGSNITLGDTPTGGTWLSNTPAVATIVAGTGVLHSIAAGTTVITYTAATGCQNNTIVTVNPLPVANTGTMHVCIGGYTMLTNTTGGGTWSSSNPAVASIGTDGTVTGNLAGTTTIIYTLPTSCTASSVVTVNSLPSFITGSSSVCAGSTTTLSDVPAGGTWSSSNTAVGTISGTGVLGGVSAGTATITYTLATGCISMGNITVNPLPNAIIGATSVCLGLQQVLLNDSAGNWSSSNPTIASIDASGVVNGNHVGAVTITFTLPVTGCRITTAFVVNPLPAAITGTALVCVGATTTLADAGGGTWYSTNPGVGTVATTTGVVTGVGSGGTTTIYYTLPTTCTTTKVVTVNPIPDPIYGVMSVCIGSTTLLYNDTLLGGWTSSNTAVATVAYGTGTGIGTVTGIASGTANMTYTLPTGCKTTAQVTVNPLPAVITGTNHVCIGGNVTLNDVTTGGTWLSNNPGVANVGPGTGIVVGNAVGADTIIYVLPTGCLRTYNFNVNPLPNAIAGTPVVCVGFTAALNDPITTGGTWISDNTGVATVGISSGVFTGVSTGTANISYTLSSGCSTFITVSVNPLPSGITGPLTMCAATTATLSDATNGGTWSSHDSTIASINSLTGVDSGVAAGTVVMTYTMGTGCYSTASITVRPLPAFITGVTTVCVGLTRSLADGTPGGTWTSSDISVAMVGLTTGIVSGIAQGVVNITYTLTTGCYRITTVTVNSLPAPISGASNMCLGTTDTLTDATSPGGTWTSSNTFVANIGASNGVVASGTPGTTTITYTLNTGCITTQVIAVNSLPSVITGTPYVCQGGTTNLGDLPAGGSWTSSNIGVATITSSGTVIGGLPGTSTISYTVGTGCSRTTVVTVNPTPASITGLGFVCTAAFDTLYDVNPGGVWTSSAPSKATVNSVTGIVAGIAQGNCTITYTLGSTCYTTFPLTVNTTPSAITGPLNVCQNGTIALNDAVPGGTWTSGDITVATIGSVSGVVSGSSTSIGAVAITYSAVGGCIATTVVTVNLSPLPITGRDTICQATDTTIYDLTVGGIWTSSNTSVATVGLVTGLLHGVAQGSTTITYAMGAGCISTRQFFVSPTPGPVTGSATVCQGLSTNLHDPYPGGTWTSGDISIASVDNSTGLVTGAVSGTTSITYSFGTESCEASFTITVNPQPAPIGGNLSICDGLSATLTEVTPGGIWTSSHPSAAPVGLTTGVVTGLSLGMDTINYTILSTGCIASAVVTINPLPTAIQGSAYVCTGGTSILVDTTLFGTWTSSSTSVADIGTGTGIISGHIAGTASITYTLPTGCITSTIIMVNQSPSPITGDSIMCETLVTPLADTTTFGAWSSSNTMIATVGSHSGDVTGQMAGSATITYTLGSGCTSVYSITVNPAPTVIAGPTSVCVGAFISLHDASAGGTWSSSNPSSGSVDAFGDVSGLIAGTTTVTYELPTGCYRTQFITVSPLPSAIGGILKVCVGSETQLSNTLPGGAWSTSNPAIGLASLDSGFVTGVSAGVVTVTYTAIAGCFTTSTLTVNAVPDAITGNAPKCPGVTDVLSDLSFGGVWSSSNANASIGTNGIVTAMPSGVTGGTATISYTTPNGCAASVIFTVNPLPYAGIIRGIDTLCSGTTVMLSDSISGGIWSSSNSSVAAIGTSGLVTGGISGNATISYIVNQICGMDTAHVGIHVNPLAVAGPISGGNQLCVGFPTTLTGAAAGGTWSSSDTVVATVSATGVVFGASAGSATITYALTNFCGTDTAYTHVTINGTFPSAKIVIHPDSTLCSNTMFQNFGALAPAPAGIQYIWSSTPAAVLYAVSSNGQNSLYNFPDTGYAVVKLSATIISSGCSISDSVVTHVTSGNAGTPPAVQYYISEFICADNTATSYQWGYDDVNTLASTVLAGQNGQDYYNPHPDTAHKNYWVITNHSGCYQKSIYNFRQTNGVTAIVPNDLDIQLYPNPAQTTINIELKGMNTADVVDVKLIDMLGKEIQSNTLNFGKGTISVAELPSGVYSIMFIQNGMKIAGKTFVKN